ncbi:MAG: hypothetical protein E7315_04695 [Clostridiales bacterium]|nr:hypothetical protein [Clostridiales bacterium]
MVNFKKYSLLWALLIAAIIILATWGIVSYIQHSQIDYYGVDGEHPTLFSVYSEDYKGAKELNELMDTIGDYYGVKLNILEVDVYADRAVANKIYDQYFNFTVVPCQILVDKNGKLLWANEESDVTVSVISDALKRYCNLK